ncbi:MAG: 4Fe-4S dicluster domain-containing protein [Candidatus Bathyarchaeia archaeon]
MSSQPCFEDGVTRLEDLQALGLVPTPEIVERRYPVAVSECIQEIPCNSCVLACKLNAITMKNINDIPIVDFNRCNGCGACLRVCPGLALFMVHAKGEKGFVTFQYELLPTPQVGEEVEGLDRRGETVTTAKVVRIFPPERNDGTALLTVEVSKNFVMDVRAIKTVKK